MSNASAEAAVWAVIQGMYDSFGAGDEAGINTALADSATVWDVFEPELIRGLQERDEFHVRDRAQSTARGPLSMSIMPLQVDFFGEVAVARYYLDFKYQPPNAVSGRVRITDVLLPTTDGWEIQHHHEGISPGGSPPTM